MFNIVQNQFLPAQLKAPRMNRGHGITQFVTLLLIGSVCSRKGTSAIRRRKPFSPSVSTFILTNIKMPYILPGEREDPRKMIREDIRREGFLLPNVPNCAKYCKTNFGAEYKDDHQLLKFCKGTTTLAFKFQGGVIVSVDSRATQGQFIGML